MDTETVTVNGNGIYTTPTGFTLPATGTVTGTYQWNATYSGDTNNNAASDINDVNERVTVSAASPTITTTPSPTTVTLGTRHGDLDRHGNPGGRLPPDRDHHVHPVLQRRRHAGGHGNGGRQRQRHLHHADRLHAAAHRTP